MVLLDVAVYIVGHKEFHVVTTADGLANECRRNLHHRSIAQISYVGRKACFVNLISHPGIYYHPVFVDYLTVIAPFVEYLPVVGTDNQYESALGIFSRSVPSVSIVYDGLGICISKSDARKLRLRLATICAICSL